MLISTQSAKSIRQVTTDVTLCVGVCVQRLRDPVSWHGNLALTIFAHLYHSNRHWSVVCTANAILLKSHPPSVDSTKGMKTLLGVHDRFYYLGFLQNRVSMLGKGKGGFTNNNSAYVEKYNYFYLRTNVGTNYRTI